MKIQVTQEDIDCGDRRNGANCLVARALNRQTRCFWSVSSFRACCCKGAVVYLPTQVIDFIASFDERYPVEPFEFELPDECLCSRAASGMTHEP